MDNYQEIKQHFLNDTRVNVNQGTGAQGIKVSIKGKPKMVIMFSKGDLLIQMAPEQVTQFIKEGKGRPYDPGTGKPMLNRLLVPAALKNTWISMAEISVQWALAQ